MWPLKLYNIYRNNIVYSNPEPKPQTGTPRSIRPNTHTHTTQSKTKQSMTRHNTPIHTPHF